MRRATGVAGTRAGLGLIAVLGSLPLGLAAQEIPFTLYVAPQGAWSENRDFAAGLRVGLELERRVSIVAEGVHFFPGTDGIAEPGVGVSRSVDRASLNVLLTLNPGHRVQIYGGLGMGYLRSRLALTVDGREEGINRRRWVTNRLIGLRASLGRYGTPFLEWGSEVSRGRPQVWAAGVAIRLFGSSPSGES